MSLLGSLVGFIILKGLLLLPFYYKQWGPMLEVTIFTSMAVAPLITLLYHETELNFWIVYFGMIAADWFILYNLVQKSVWKAIVSSIISNTVTIIFFFLVNG